jgi:uncharacterized protein (TIGR00369 family)
VNQPFPTHIPFVSLLGMTLESTGQGESRIQLIVRSELENHLGLAHGGVLMTLLDVAMAQAARNYPGVESSLAGSQSVITIEMKTTFFQPSLGTLVAHGTLLHRTGRMAFAQATVYNAEGLRCAHATGTFRYVAPQAALAAPMAQSV